VLRRTQLYATWLLHSGNASDVSDLQRSKATFGMTEGDSLQPVKFGEN
jgi:hypothetical protein